MSVSPLIGIHSVEGGTKRAMKPRGTTDAGFVIKLDEVGCVSHVYWYSICLRIEMKCWNIWMLA